MTSASVPVRTRGAVHRRLATALAVLAALVGVLVGAAVLTAPDETTTGEVVASGGNVDGCYPTVAFTVDGQSYRTTAPEQKRWCALDLDGPATVYYDPASPEDGRIDRHGEAPVRLALVAVALLALALLVLVHERRSGWFGTGTPASPGPLPASAVVLALSSLAGQLLVLAEDGPRTGEDGAILANAVLAAVVLGWVATGVLKARGVRTGLAWVTLGLVLAAEVSALIGLPPAPELAWSLTHAVLTLVQLGALAWFGSSRHAAWQRSNRGATAPGVAPLVLVAALVGVLSAVTAPAADDAAFRLELNL